MTFTDEKGGVYPRIALIPGFYPRVGKKVLFVIFSSRAFRESRLNRLVQLQESKILNVKESSIVSFDLKSHVCP